jgi:hypothetical protein
VLPILIAMILGSWLLVNVIVEDSWRVAERNAEIDGAWLHVVDGGLIGGLALVAVIFVGILATAWVFGEASARVQPFPAPNVFATTLGSPSGGNGAALAESVLRRVVRRAAEQTSSADDFLKAASAGQIRMWRVAMLAVGIPCALAILVTHANNWTAGPKGVVLHSWWSTTTIPLSEAHKVVTGCNSTDDEEDLIFYVHFPNRKFDLAGDGGFNFSHPEITAEKALDVVTRVDEVLPSIPRERWQWMGRNPLASRCMSYWYAVAGDVDRINRLLRADVESP